MAAKAKQKTSDKAAMLAPLAAVTKTLYPIDLFTPDPQNARGHSDANIQAIANSIKQFGQRIPILIETGNVIRKGNGTWLAMKRLGLTDIWAIPLELEGPVADAFALADNRSAELAHWEWQIVQKTLQELQAAGHDITELGFADYELEPLLQASWQPPAIDDDATAAQAGKPQPTDCTVTLSLQEYEAITLAIAKLRKRLKDPELTEGQALVTICSEWGRR